MEPSSSPLALQVPAEIPRAPFVPSEVDALPDEALDRLPFGVIALDEADNIIRYNLAEARFARLERRSVLGRRFFGEVAPCTATAAFEGRVRAFRADPSLPSLRFPYVFDFRFGAQEVEVEAVRVPVPGVVYLFVNRRKSSGVRNVPESQFAPRLSELSKDELPGVVQRDERDGRRLQTTPEFWQAMRETWDRVAPQGWPLFNEEWGLAWGRLAVVGIEGRVIEDGRGSLKDVNIREALRYVADDLRRLGLGELRADFSAAGDGLFTLELVRGAIAESVGFSEVPRCHLIAGYLRGVFGHLADKALVVKELRCAAQGHGTCTFVVASRRKAAHLDRAMSEAGDDLGRVVEAFVAEVRRDR